MLSSLHDISPQSFHPSYPYSYGDVGLPWVRVDRRMSSQEIERDGFVRDRHNCFSNPAVYPERLHPHNRFNCGELRFAVGQGGNDMSLTNCPPAKAARLNNRESVCLGY
jgi:hypothetical protein